MPLPAVGAGTLMDSRLQKRRLSENKHGLIDGLTFFQE
jgi:hypothetical protein